MSSPFIWQNDAPQERPERAISLQGLVGSYASCLSCSYVSATNEKHAWRRNEQEGVALWEAAVARVLKQIEQQHARDDDKTTNTLKPPC